MQSRRAHYAVPREDFDEAAKAHRASLSQNFLVNIDAIDEFLHACGDLSDTTVVEVGPGSGALTHLLAAKAARVIAIEKDPELAVALTKKMHMFNNLEITTADFLEYALPDTVGEYALIANPPFSIMTALLKKALLAQNPPESVVLVSQREAAERFIMRHRSYEFGLHIAPWFESEIVFDFQPTDFAPQPGVPTVLLRMRRRQYRFAEAVYEHPDAYRAFVSFVFHAQKEDMYHALKSVVTFEQWKRMTKDLRVPRDTTATDLLPEQWAELFDRVMRFVPPEKRAIFL